MPKKPQFEMTDLHYQTLAAVKALGGEPDFSHIKPNQSQIRKTVNRAFKGSFDGPATKMLTQMVNLGLIREQSDSVGIDSLYIVTEKGNDALEKQLDFVDLPIADQSKVGKYQGWGNDSAIAPFGDLTKG